MYDICEWSALQSPNVSRVFQLFFVFLLYVWCFHLDFFSSWNKQCGMRHPVMCSPLYSRAKDAVSTGSRKEDFRTVVTMDTSRKVLVCAARIQHSSPRAMYKVNFQGVLPIAHVRASMQDVEAFDGVFTVHCVISHQGIVLHHGIPCGFISNLCFVTLATDPTRLRAKIQSPFDFLPSRRTTCRNATLATHFCKCMEPNCVPKGSFTDVTFRVCQVRTFLL